MDSYPDAYPGGHLQRLTGSTRPPWTSWKSATSQELCWFREVFWPSSAAQITQSISCLLPLPSYHPTHCKAQSVWPQLSWKARPLILSLQAAGRSHRTISPPTIKNHITEGSGAGPAFHHGGVCEVYPSCSNPGDAVSQTRPRNLAATNQGPKCPYGILPRHPIYIPKGHP